MEITAAALAAELCGASQEDPLLAVLCEAAEAAWESRLDPGVTKEDCGGALRCAAAFMAAADYMGKRCRAESFTVCGRGDGTAERRPIHSCDGGDLAADGGAADASLCRLRGVLLQGGAGMTGVMGEILEHYGQTVTLRSRDGEKSVRAFIQPAAARDETVPGEQTPIGWIDERLWRYTGLEEVQPGDTVIWRGRSFRVRSSREHALSDEINHWWALLEPERRAAE